MGNSIKKQNRCRGFGIIEILISIVVLGFLMTALLNLQLGNRDALLRIRARDGAVDVAQDAIDSLSILGVSALSKTALPSQKISFSKTRSWQRTGGFPIKVNYNVEINVSDDATYASEEKSYYGSMDHTYAKRLDVKVSWPFKGTTHSINYSGVIR
jgi:prepilin-type N-terminal cleavage/methylation domain-containing protein